LPSDAKEEKPFAFTKKHYEHVSLLHSREGKGERVLPTSCWDKERKKKKE